MAKEMERVIGASDKEIEVILHLEDVNPETGFVALAGPLNQRTQGITIPLSNEFLKALITATKNANTLYDILVEDMIRDQYRSLGKDPIKLVDMVDAVKAGEYVTSYIYTYYSANEGMISFCKMIEAIIASIDNAEVLEKTLDEYRGQYYLLTGGNTRMCILLDEDDKSYKVKKDLELRAVVQKLSICDSAIAPALRRRTSDKDECLSVMQNAVKLCIMAMIAEDNNSSKETMTGTAQEISVANLYRACYEANLYDLKKEATFTDIYRAYSGFFAYCGYKKPDKVLNCVLGQDALKFLKGTGHQKNAQRSFIKGCLEALFQCGFKGDFSFIEKNAIVVKDREGLNRIYEEIVNIHTAGTMEAVQMNGDCLKKYIKRILKGKYIGKTVTVDEMIAILNKAVDDFYGEKTFIEELKMHRTDRRACKRIIDKAMKHLEEYEKKDLIKIIMDLSEIIGEAY